ncbi:Uncharacterised protein [Vibrio cholerae]|nr:Uncharacterised protein [Vibrio cholerae]
MRRNTAFGLAQGHCQNRATGLDQFHIPTLWHSPARSLVG